MVLNPLNTFLTDNIVWVLIISALFVALIIYAALTTRSKRQVQTLMFTDQLTNIYNARYLETHFSDILMTIDESISFYYINIDNFKNYNDLFGFHVADKLLKGFSSRLTNIAPASSHVFRVHSDRFIVLSAARKDKDGAFTNELLKKLKKPYTIDEHEFRITVSIGRYVISDERPLYQDVLLKSELALDEAKRIGKDQAVVYDSRMREDHHNMFDMYRFIKDALKNNTFYMEFQPIMDTKNKTLAGLEALIRFKAKRKLLFPGDIINYAEKFNLIDEIDRYVIKHTFEAYRRFKQEGVPIRFIAVNISSSELHNSDFLTFIKQMLKEYSIDPKEVVIEFTETVDPQKLENESRFISDLRAIGLRVAIDDFGSGYSSMIRLSRTKLDRIKIDKSFVSNIVTSPSNQALIKAMVDLGRAFNLDVVVEGVETQAEYDFMLQQGIDYIQGYYFYRAMNTQAVITSFTNQDS